MPSGHAGDSVCRGALADLLSPLACTYMAATTWLKESAWLEHMWTRPPLIFFQLASERYFDEASLRWLFFSSKCTRRRKETTNKQELVQNQHSNFLWTGCLATQSGMNCTLVPSAASPWLRSNCRCRVYSKWDGGVGGGGFQRMV